MSNKKSWPYLVGKPIDEAVAVIQKENSDLSVIKLEEGSPITYDLRNNRVRVFYNKDGKVSLEPSIG